MAINPEVFKPSDVRNREVVMPGVRNPKVYPTRAAIYEALKNEPFFDCIERQRENASPWERWPVGRDFARVLGSTKICPTGGSVFHYPVSKYFEIAACGALVYSDWFEELGLLGFQPEVNMVEVDHERILEQVLELLGEPERCDFIASECRNMVLSRHTFAQRASETLHALGHPERVLWLTIDRSQRVMSHFDSLREAVGQLTHVDTVFRSTHGLEAGTFSFRCMCRGLEIEPYDFDWSTYDFVISDAFFAYASDEWFSIRVQKAVLLEDMQRAVPKKQLEKAALYETDVILFRYLKPFESLCQKVGVDVSCLTTHLKDMEGSMSTRSWPRSSVEGSSLRL